MYLSTDGIHRATARMVWHLPRDIQSAKAYRDNIWRQIKRFLHQSRIEKEYPARADADIPGFKHHVGADYGSIHFPAVVALDEGTFPTQPRIVAYKKNCRSIICASSYGSNFIQSLLALKHIYLLRLMVYGSRRNLSGFKNQVQFLRLNLPRRKRAHRPARSCKFEKVAHIY